MIYSDFQGIKLPKLGLGAMRLPKTPDGAIDEIKTREMVRYAMENGVNYFDTAYPYHGGMSEIVMGKVLSEYPRNSFYLASKYPGHQVSENYKPAEVFEKQLQKCQVDYFDFYLLHNLNDSSFEIYSDPKLGIVDFFLEQKRIGRIKHLGFSSHASLPVLKAFLDLYGDKMEFCQIQLNYLDRTLQNAEGQYNLLCERGISVWVMEPVRGGKLANLMPSLADRLKAVRPDDSPAAWCFRWLFRLNSVAVILSGMSNMEQLMDNIKTFNSGECLSDSEAQLLYEIAEYLKQAVPCTSCRYCCDGCPMGLDIPRFIMAYNDLKLGINPDAADYISALSDDKKPSSCLSCGACSASCPQKIDIPKVLSDFEKLCLSSKA